MTRPFYVDDDWAEFAEWEIAMFWLGLIVGFYAGATVACVALALYLMKTDQKME